MEYYAFIHFNMNTFTGKEWGAGDESPELFNPSDLDCRQWARICKAAGMKGIIITAKHHDGFCLWPSAFTEHSVKNSPWKDGKGDLLKELREACDEYGLKLGLYLSPWDRNHAEYGHPEYLIYFRNQLTEILTHYGEIFEVWFDGANGGSGYYGGANETRTIDRETYYDWEQIRQLVLSLQPKAIIFSDNGPGARWIGNEQGFAGETCWALLNPDSIVIGAAGDKLKLLNEGDEYGNCWIPGEVDVSIRPGWYYHPAEDSLVKSTEKLLQIYFNSVGRGANLLLNIPVDRRGLINENDSVALIQCRKALDTLFARDLAKGTRIEASNTRGGETRYQALNVIDGNKESYWAADDSVTRASLTLDFERPARINHLLVQEYIPLGQRVRSFNLEALEGMSWRMIAQGTTIGYKKLVQFPTVECTKLRFTVLDAKACPIISTIEIYFDPDQ